MLYDVIVVGGASAGLTAALYASRQGLKTLVVTKDVGGQALLTDSIQNYPGFLDIGGFDLMSKFEEQAKAYGADFLYDEVVEVREHDECPTACFKVRTATGKEFDATAVILAFGKTPRDLGVPGEEKLKGRGVSYCAVCDAPLYKDKVVGVVGSADQALEAAQICSGLAREVYLIHAFDKPIGDEELLERLKAKPNLRLLPNSRVVELKGEARLEAAVVQDTKTGEKRELKLDGLFIEIGYVSKTGFIKNLVQLDGKGEIVVNMDGSTSKPGVFAAGDVTNIPYKQAVISAGMGATAALSAYNYIQRIRGKPGVRADWKSIKPAA